MKFAVVGAGFTGGVLAHELSKKGHEVKVFETRGHIAGNCYTKRDEETGIMLHKYGPHIFHTDSDKVWEYITQFAEFMPFVNRVKIVSEGKVFSLPINLHTINQYFNKTFKPQEAKAFIETLVDNSIKTPVSFEEQALKVIGKELYEAFFEGYTIKQWGIKPKSLPASILKRLPVRFNYNDNYFNHKYQGIPKEGYTLILEKLLVHKNIDVHLNTKFTEKDARKFDHILYSGPIDSWFNHAYGRLGYRTLDFKREEHSGDYQGCAVMNYGDIDVPYTRITEHKYFSPWEKHNKTIIFKEYSRSSGQDDSPYYPIRLAEDKAKLEIYRQEAKKSTGISFLGRLGTYRYIDMDVTIEEALVASKKILSAINERRMIPVFFDEYI